MDGRAKSLRARLACHCLLIETRRGLVLVDTGFGLRDVADPRSRLSRFFLALMEPDLREEMTAIRQIERLGFDAREVTDILLTHLDFDHAGGLDDFPQATVHLLQSERHAAFHRPSLLDRMRYRPQQWSTQGNWRVHDAAEGDTWFGFHCVRRVGGLPPEILMVPLVGHTLGHAGIAVDTGGGWLLQAGDAYFWHDEMNVDRPSCTPGLRAFQRLMEKNRHARLWNQERLRELVRDHGRDVTVFCAHDPDEFERLAGRELDELPGTRLRPARRPEKTHAEQPFVVRELRPKQSSKTSRRHR